MSFNHINLFNFAKLISLVCTCLIIMGPGSCSSVNSEPATQSNPDIVAIPDLLPFPTPSVREPTLNLVATAITTGGEHSCALISDGTVRCWGNGYNGELGNGGTGTTLTHTVNPVSVIGLNTTVTALTSGSDHTCALTSAGGVMCWGTNDSGQLGNNTTTRSPVPIDVIGLTSGVAAISAGYKSTCALMSTGTVKCWGSNSWAQLGDGTTIQRKIPVDVIGLPPGIAGVAVAGLGTCVLTSAGGVMCWGERDTIGNTLLNDAYSGRPQDVAGLGGRVTYLSGGDGDFFVVLDNGGVQGWGANGNGQLGDGITMAPKHRTPVYIPSLGPGSNAVMVQGEDAICAVRRQAPLKCWGKNDYSQASGDGAKSLAQAPTDVTSLTEEVIALAPSISHTCVIVRGGKVKCWGRNDYGRIGDGTETDRDSPADVIW